MTPTVRERGGRWKWGKLICEDEGNVDKDGNGSRRDHANFSL